MYGVPTYVLTTDVQTTWKLYTIQHHVQQDIHIFYNVKQHRKTKPVQVESQSYHSLETQDAPSYLISLYPMPTTISPKSSITHTLS